MSDTARQERFQSFEEKTDPAQGRERLALLRGELKRRGLDGFVVPRSDEHQNEYCPPSEERLAWLTGFAGSAGLAIILADEATIFVDGRYTVQVQEQVDTSVITPRHLINEPPETWLRQALKAGQKLGFDPRLHTIAETGRFSEACKAVGADWVAVANNPIDSIWTDRPQPPLCPVTLHDEALAGESAASKLERIRQRLKELHADAVFTNDAHAVAWALNIRGGDVAHTPLPLSFMLIPSEGAPTLFIDGRKLSNQIRDNLSALVSIAEPGQIERTLPDAIKAKTIRLDPNVVTERFARIATTAGAAIQRGPDPIALLRAVKNKAEQEGARAAHVRDGAAVTKFLAWLADHAPQGVASEISAAEALEGFRRETGRLKDVSFPSISSAGPNAAIPHYRVTWRSNRLIEPGLFLIDSGAQYEDGTTDVTRTVAIGEPTPLMRDRYTRVLKGVIAISRARFPKGTCGAQLDSFARAALWEIGCDYDHGTGHGVGSYLSVHEGPQRLSKLGTTPLEAGMILSNEPGYYRPGEFGIRIENLVLVTDISITGAERPMLGFETLTFAPIDTAPIERALLTHDEIAWLDTYHATVREKLSALVDETTRKWLAAATSPLGS